MMRFATAGVMILFAGSPALAQGAGQGTLPAMAVGVVPVTKQSVAKGQSFTGRIEAIERVDIRARITGFIEEVLFKDGDTVAAGAPLYRIEQAPFQAAVQQARGALLQAQANYANASAQRARAEDLVKTNATSVSTRDERVAAEQSAQGAVVRADADLKTAQIDLTYTEINSPIAGRIGRSLLTKGNVVGPNAGVLTSVLSINPVYVTFPVSQREFLQVEDAERKRQVASVTVRLQFEDGSAYPLPGKIDFIGVSVDRTTDTITVRATVPNPNGSLVDGQFVKVSVQGEKPEEKLVVPQAALIVDQAGIYVFVVQDGKAVVKRVTLGDDVGRNVVVESGLNPGDQVVVEGIQGVRPNAPVLASPARAVLQGG